MGEPAGVASQDRASPVLPAAYGPESLSLEVVVASGAKPRVSIRFSPEELEQVRETAEALGLTLSAFIRAACLGERLRPKPGRVTREAIHQLARVGNNLNQLTHWANTHKHFRSLRELEDILELVREKIEELS